MISATEKNWKIANYLYIARRLQEISQRKKSGNQGNNQEKLKVLDMGCGEGKVMELLLDYDYDLYGYDVPTREVAIRKRMGNYFKDKLSEHIHFMDDERKIPFPDQSFDVIYSNQVFEHVKFLDAMMAECARVLKPGGVLLTNFPVATYPLEGHLKVPFVHWLPPGSVRVAYLRFFYALKFRPKLPSCNAKETAIRWDDYLRNKTYYRFMNEIFAVFNSYFKKTIIETEHYWDAKLDLMATHKKVLPRLGAFFLRKLNRRFCSFLVTHFYNAAFYVVAKPSGEAHLENIAK